MYYYYSELDNLLLLILYVDDFDIDMTVLYERRSTFSHGPTLSLPLRVTSR